MLGLAIHIVTKDSGLRVERQYYWTLDQERLPISHRVKHISRRAAGPPFALGVRVGPLPRRQFRPSSIFFRLSTIQLLFVPKKTEVLLLRRNDAIDPRSTFPNFRSTPNLGASCCVAASARPRGEIDPLSLPRAVAPDTAISAAISRALPSALRVACRNPVPAPLRRLQARRV